MCNLYKMTSTVDEMKQVFGSFEGDRKNLPAFDSIYPETEAPIIKSDGGNLSVSVIKWGIPSWKEKAGPITNVRNLDSSFWRGMIGKPEAKCLVPVSRFCEWDGPKGNKRKVWFALKDQPLFAFAGIWRDTSEGPRFAFLTTKPNSLVEPIHPKAMPVIIHRDCHQDWLDSDYNDAFGLAMPYPANQMEIVAE
jgi:putative SOS response-associated peptidase YedK